MFILAAALIVAGVALFVAAPLGIGLVGARAKSAGELQVERHEHERALAVQGLRELEFDREMGKLSDADYESMHKALEDRALTAMAAVENIRVQTDKASNAKKPSVTPLAPFRADPHSRAVSTRYRLSSCTPNHRARRNHRRRRRLAVAQDQLLSAMRDARRARLEVLRAMRYRDQADRRGAIARTE